MDGDFFVGGCLVWRRDGLKVVEGLPLLPPLFHYTVRVTKAPSLAITCLPDTLSPSSITHFPTYDSSHNLQHITLSPLALENHLLVEDKSTGASFDSSS